MGENKSQDRGGFYTRVTCQQEPLHDCFGIFEYYVLAGHVGQIKLSTKVVEEAI